MKIFISNIYTIYTRLDKRRDSKSIRFQIRSSFTWENRWEKRENETNLISLVEGTISNLSSQLSRINLNSNQRERERRRRFKSRRITLLLPVKVSWQTSASLPRNGWITLVWKFKQPFRHICRNTYGASVTLFARNLSCETNESPPVFHRHKSRRYYFTYRGNATNIKIN